jgi:hypothetical protein
MSAAWEQLAAAGLEMVQGLGVLAQLAPDTQGQLLALILAPTRCIGAETAAYVEVEDLSSAAVQKAVAVSTKCL